MYVMPNNALLAGQCLLSNFKCLSLVLLHLYDSYHRNFEKLLKVLCKLFKDIAACLKCYICKLFDTH